MNIAGGTVATEDMLLTKIESGIYMPAESVRFLVIHCTATREDQDYTPEQLRRDHQRRGFIDVGCTNSHCSEKAKVLRLITFHHTILLIFCVWISSDLSHTRHSTNKFGSVLV